MVKSINKDNKKVKEDEDVQVNVVKVKEDEEEVKEDVKQDEDSNKKKGKKFILWYKHNKDDDWHRIERTFKTEVSANNHNLFVLGHKITVILKESEIPE